MAMAKSKKSKILASVLAASTMAVFYASPVMAEDGHTYISSSNASVGTTESGEINFRVNAGSGSAKVGMFDKDSFTIYNGSGTWSVFEIDRNDGDFWAANKQFRVDKAGVVTSTNFLTANGANLDTVANNTAGITREKNTTTIEGSTSFDSTGMTVSDGNTSTKTKANGYFVKQGYQNVASLTANQLTVGGENVITANNGSVTAYLDRAVYGDESGQNVVTKSDGIYLKNNNSITASLTEKALTLNGKQIISNNGTDVIGKFDRVEAGNTVVKNEGIFVKEDTRNASSLTKDGLNLNDGTYNASLNAAQLANINSVVQDGGVVSANALNVKGQFGSFNVADVPNGNATNTMIYVENEKGENTLYIDTHNGNLVTEGAVSAGDGAFVANNTGIAVGGDKFAVDAATGNVATKGAFSAGDGAFVANDTGIAVGEKFAVNAENGGVQAVEYKVNDNNVLNASGLKATAVTANSATIGNVEITGDTVDGVDVSELSDTVGSATLNIDELQKKTQNIDVDNTDNSKTTFNGSVIADSFKTQNNKFYVTADGAMVAANGDFKVTNDGTTTATNFVTEHGDFNTVADKTAGISQFKYNTTYFNGAISATGSVAAGGMGNEAIIGGNTTDGGYLQLRDANNVYQVLRANQLANINNVIQENGVVQAADGSVIGGVGFTDGAMKGVNSIDGAEVQAWGNGGLEISGVAMENGAIKVNKINGAEVNYYGEGGLEISGVGLLNGDVSAQTINGVTIEQSSDTDGAIINGVDIGKLDDIVTNTTENVAGISREDETTNIEGRLFVSKDEFYLGGYGEGSNWIHHDENGTTFGGNVSFNNGHKVSFYYDGGQTNLGDLALTVDDLVDKVDDIYNRTQGIDRDDNGNTVISNDGRKWENGQSTVTDGNGATVTVGEDGVTFESDNASGTTNINGGTITTDKTLVGNVAENTGSGTGSGITGTGVVTDNSMHSGKFTDTDSSYEFTANADGFISTAKDEEGKNITTVTHDKTGSYVNVTGDNIFASSGVGMNDGGAFIDEYVSNGDTTAGEVLDYNGSTTTVENGKITHNVTNGTMTDTVTNGEVTVTETKDETGHKTTVTDGTTISDVTQDKDGLHVSTPSGTTNISGSDVKVTNNEGQSIYMSDIGYVDDIDDELKNQDGEKTTVVDAVNNEAQIRRDEINRVDGRIDRLENRVDHLEDRIDKVGAMAAAIANLRTMGYDPAAPTEVAVGLGQYRDETGAALGLFHYPDRDFMLSLSVSTSGDEVMGGIGATRKFGRKSPEKVAEIKKAQAEADVRRAEAQKLAKAEELKEAAREAKIKAQMERHAKLAAERAAQAEAK